MAVLVLRDVLGFPAKDVAEMLDTSVESVTSALKRARATLQRRAVSDREPPPDHGSPVENALVSAFVTAYEASDVDAVVALLTDDVLVSMPPVPLEYEGREAAAAFCAAVITRERTFRLVRTRANGQPAFGIYLMGPDGLFHGTGLLVLDLSGDRVCALTRFESGTLAWFGLPRSLPAH